MQCLRLSSGDQVAVSPFQPPREGFGAALLSLELDYVSKRRAAAATEYDAKTLAKHILARYVGQVHAAVSLDRLYPFRGSIVHIHRSDAPTQAPNDILGVVEPRTLANEKERDPSARHWCCCRCFRWIRSW